MVEILGSGQCGAGFEKERYVTLEMHGAREVSAGREQDLAASGRRTCINCFIYRRSVERRAVPYSPIVSNAEHAGLGGDSRLSSGHQTHYNKHRPNNFADAVTGPIDTIPLHYQLTSCG
ncbi:MAG TPA: hypothetical protein VMW72_20530 [Sedimentisphaerales bacterium]|nr:hypothetical protein [Sedimentisphaerales bacterium]